MGIWGSCVQRSIIFPNIWSKIYEITKNWNDCQGQNSILLHVLLAWNLSSYQNEKLKQNFHNVNVLCSYFCQI